MTRFSLQTTRVEKAGNGWGICCSTLWLATSHGCALWNYCTTSISVMAFSIKLILRPSHARVSSGGPEQPFDLWRYAERFIAMWHEKVWNLILQIDLIKRLTRVTHLYISSPLCFWLVKEILKFKSLFWTSKAPASQIPSQSIKLSLTSFILALFIDCFSPLLAFFPAVCSTD